MTARPRRLRYVAAAAAGALLLTFGCGDVRTPRSDASAALGADVFAPGVISDARWQYRITFTPTPEGDTAYFTVADGFFPQTRRATIYVTSRAENGAWQTPQVAPFSGEHVDIDPFVTPDGARLYFSSIRPHDGELRSALDLFVMVRTDTGWSEPVRLGPEVNTDLDELYASVDAAGTLYFASGPPAPTPDANWNVYRAHPDGAGFLPRVRLDGINLRQPWDADRPTRDWTFNPEISRDGRTLIFTSLREGGYGLGDLYISRLEADGWSAPRNLGPLVNTEHDEYHPTLSPDGRWLYFARTLIAPQVVPSNFYRIPVESLDAGLLPPDSSAEATSRRHDRRRYAQPFRDGTGVISP